MLDVGIEGVKVMGYPRDLGQVVECTGQTLWRGGELLARWILENKIQFERCLEVGAGLGLCSLVAEKCSKKRSVVVATDGDDLAVDMLRRNIELNQSGVYVRKLRWGDAEAANSILDEFGGRFDHVLAADVVYDESAVEFLVETFAKMLSETGTIFFSFTHRGVALEIVIETLSRAGFVAEEVASSTAKRRRPDSNDDSLLRITRRKL